jgi:hypothetical protein
MNDELVLFGLYAFFALHPYSLNQSALDFIGSDELNSSVECDDPARMA